MRTEQNLMREEKELTMALKKMGEYQRESISEDGFAIKKESFAKILQEKIWDSEKEIEKLKQEISDLKHQSWATSNILLIKKSRLNVQRNQT